ncbi:transcriptional regulator TrmB [Burkholderia sp. WAC0059]|uniref:TrmB family transcriptional regulator n=1 Tax=Burkholderia sp. WAC0059 TaxID=2066022 RepID=UPI000C7EC514|nr:helix-turn-helix domain-containing protein [Burkholderia sp. WAC0059]PLZ00597.1 transcriptional regulator TrmB [Burkholderia sp. WAC0059]
MDLEASLDQIGIRGKLYHAYMAALELGETSVNQIAARAGLGRTTAYSVLERLQEAGVINLVERGDKRVVVAEDPQVLLQRIETRRRTLIDLMPQLRSLYNQSRAKPEIRFYEGPEGVLTVLWDTLTVRSGVLRGILSMAELLESPGPDKMREYIARRIEARIPLKVLRSPARETNSIWPGSADEIRELRYAPPGITLGMTVYLYDDKVAIISSKREDYGLIIQSHDFATLLTGLFDGLWMISSEPPGG